MLQNLFLLRGINGSSLLLPIGGAQGPYRKSDRRAVPASGGPQEPAKLHEGPVQQALPSQSRERCQPLPPGFPQPAASAQRQHEGTGGLVRASSGGSAEEETGGRGRLEKVQGARGGSEGLHVAPERGHTETRTAESLSGGEDHVDGEREGGACRTTQGRVTDIDVACSTKWSTRTKT